MFAIEVPPSINADNLFIWQNSHRLLINIISSGIIGKFGRPGKSAPGYSVILRCHWRDSP